MLPVTFILIFVFLLISISVAFYFKNKHLKYKQKQYVAHLMKRIEENQQQINIRNRNLAAYNFLRYNLDEALLVQNSINL